MLNPGWVPNIPVGIAAVIIGAAGVIVSIKPPTGKWRFIAAGFFVVLCTAECLFIWKQAAAADKAAETQSSEMFDLKTSMQAAELKNSSDLGYLKGRLDQAISTPKQTYDFAALGKSIAESNANLIAQQQKSFTDKQLRDESISFAKRMRAFETNMKAHLASIETPPQGMPRDQLNNFYAQRGALVMQAYQQASEQFRSQYLGQLLEFRDQIKDRLIQENKPIPVLEQYKGLAFDGVLAGVSPVSDAADYLELLARQLQP